MKIFLALNYKMQNEYQNMFILTSKPFTGKTFLRSSLQPRLIYLETLKEALTSYGYINSMYRDRVKAVKFNFDNNIVIRG